MKVKTEFTAYQGMPYWQQEKTKIEQVFSVSKIWEVQEAMENFVFPDNLQGMLIFCQMA